MKCDANINAIQNYIRKARLLLLEIRSLLPATPPSFSRPLKVTQEGPAVKVAAHVRFCGSSSKTE